MLPGLSCSRDGGTKEKSGDGCPEPRRVSEASPGRTRERELSLGKEMGGSSKDREAPVAR